MKTFILGVIGTIFILLMGILVYALDKWLEKDLKEQKDYGTKR